MRCERPLPRWGWNWSSCPSGTAAAQPIPSSSTICWSWPRRPTSWSRRGTRRGRARVTTACTTCYNVLKRTNHFIREHEEERERINAFIEAEYSGEVEVKDILHLLRDDVGFDAVQDKVQKPLKDLKVAAYYGCMVLRPPDEVAYDDPDQPQSLDDLMAALGATPVDFPTRTSAAAPTWPSRTPDVTREMVYTILKSAQAAGAEAVATNCPLCQFNLDKQQAEMRKALCRLPAHPGLLLQPVDGPGPGAGCQRLWLGAALYRRAAPAASERGFWNGQRADAS